jgi:hypothetical protein
VNDDGTEVPYLIWRPARSAGSARTGLRARLRRFAWATVPDSGRPPSPAALHSLSPEGSRRSLYCRQSLQSLRVLPKALKTKWLQSSFGPLAPGCV